MRVLYVDIDTLRPDHMGCYGYSRNTTPNLDEIAKDGVRFTRCYCSDAPCLPSRAALMTGTFGIASGVVGHGGTAGDRRLTGASRDFLDQQDLANFNYVFRNAGMHTVSFSTFAERHSAHWYTAGFHEVYNVGNRGIESGEQVVDAAVDWLERNKERDSWYMHLHVWDPHTPYRTPANRQDAFTDKEVDAWVTPEIFAEHLRHTGPHGVNELSMYTDAQHPRFPKQPGKVTCYEDLHAVFNGYDNGIHYADEVLGRVFELLRQQGIYEDTAIIITSDHGENYGELGIYAEHATADEATCHIPLIVKWPGGAKGRVAEGLHYLLDLPPTMAELLNVQASPLWDGQSCAKAILGGEDGKRDALVLSQMAHVCQRSARFGRWLYIRTYHDGYHLFDKEMLFDLEADPYEQKDVKDEHPEICAQGAKIILDWHDEQMAKSSCEIDPLWTVVHEGGPYHTWDALPAYLQRLRETGRAAGAALLEKKYCGKK